MFCLVPSSLDNQGCTILHIYEELKQEVGFKGYLKYVKGPLSNLFVKICSGTHRFLMSRVGMLRGVHVSQNCPNCGACKESVEPVLFDSASCDSQGQSWTI